MPGIDRAALKRAGQRATQGTRLRAKRGVVVAAVAALAWIPTACSSSAESGSASEAPLKLMLISTIQSPAFGFPEAVDGAKAAAKAINDAGGANGHRIEVEACNDQYNANTAAACAQKAVKEKFSGVITGYTSFGSQIMPFLEMKKVPFVGGQPSTAKEWNSPQAYPFSAGNNGYFAAIAQQMHKQGCTKMGLITNSNAQSADAGKAAAKAFEQAGGEIVYKVSIPPTTADTAPQVAALVKSGAQCVSDIIPPVTLLNFLTALQSAAPDMLAGCTGPDDATLAKISAAAKGCIRAEQSYPASDPHMADFTSALHEYKADAQVDVWSLNAYNGVLAFAQAAKTASDVTGPSLSKALDKMQFTPEGYPAPVDFSKSAGISGYDRLFNTTAVLMHFDGAKLVADGPVQLGDTLQHVLAGS